MLHSVSLCCEMCECASERGCGSERVRDVWVRGWRKRSVCAWPRAADFYLLCVEKGVGVGENGFLCAGLRVCDADKVLCSCSCAALCSCSVHVLNSISTPALNCLRSRPTQSLTHLNARSHSCIRGVAFSPRSYRLQRRAARAVSSLTAPQSLGCREACMRPVL